MTTTQFPVLDNGFVSLITEPDSDLKVVNAARVSFHKTSRYRRVPHPGGQIVGLDSHEELDPKDIGLIQYLAKHRHWTPFAHCSALAHVSTDEYLDPDKVERLLLPGASTFYDPEADIVYIRVSLAHLKQDPSLTAYFPEKAWHSVNALLGLKDEDGPIHKLGSITSHWRECPVLAPVTLHMKMPIFVARQFMKHCVGVVYNEVSRRYVDEPPEFYVPDQWRGRPQNKKQGSDGVVDLSEFMRTASPGEEAGSSDPARSIAFVTSHVYKGLLDAGVAPEMARIVLPVSMYTEFWATMGLRDAARIYALRNDPHAQLEIQAFAKAMDEAILTSQWAEFWPAIRDNTLKEYASGD